MSDINRDRVMSADRARDRVMSAHRAGLEKRSPDDVKLEISLKHFSILLLQTPEDVYKQFASIFEDGNSLLTEPLLLKLLYAMFSVYFHHQYPDEHLFTSEEIEDVFLKEMADIIWARQVREGVNLYSNIEGIKLCCRYLHEFYNNPERDLSTGDLVHTISGNPARILTLARDERETIALLQYMNTARDAEFRSADELMVLSEKDKLSRMVSEHLTSSGVPDELNDITTQYFQELLTIPQFHKIIQVVDDDDVEIVEPLLRKQLRELGGDLSWEEFEIIVGELVAATLNNDIRRAIIDFLLHEEFQEENDVKVQLSAPEHRIFSSERFE